MSAQRTPRPLEREYPMSRKLVPLIVGLVASVAVTTPAQQPATNPGVAEILASHDRALIRDLARYLKVHPKADDRDQAYAALFNKAIEHDWFPESESIALQYLHDEPEGPVRALAQIITTM